MRLNSGTSLETIGQKKHFPTWTAEGVNSCQDRRICLRMGPQRARQSQEVEGDHFLTPPFEYLEPVVPEAVTFGLFSDCANNASPLPFFFSFFYFLLVIFI